MDTPDSELLRRYSEERSESAFAEFVERHVGLVYSTALRKAHGDTHCAKDISQAVFSTVAQKARSLRTCRALGGWLYTTTLYVAAKTFRGERRRRIREQEASAMQKMETNEESSWAQIEPILDDSMRQLNEADREALVLRYFQHFELKSVGDSLGISEEAARKRVQRALAKLRDVLVKRGVVTSEGGLALVLASMLTLSVPTGLAAFLAQTALATATTMGGTALFFHIMTATKTKSLCAAAAVLLSGGSAMYLHHQNRNLQRQISNLQQELGRAENELNSATTRLSALPGDKELAMLRADHLEAIRLRGLATKLQRQLKSQTNAIAESAQPEPLNLAETDDSYWLHTFTATLDVKVPPQQSLLTGGWETENGKRAFVMITPTRIDAAGNISPNGNQVTIETHWIEAKSDVLPDLGLADFQADSDASTQQQLCSSEKVSALFDLLKNTAGVDFLTAPKVTTLSARQARISVEDAFSAPNGHQLSTGTTLDVLPTLSEDGGLQLALEAKMALKRSEHFPAKETDNEADAAAEDESQK
jgi:RNA polymerase sigma factor (sigma-70 family)